MNQESGKRLDLREEDFARAWPHALARVLEAENRMRDGVEGLTTRIEKASEQLKTLQLHQAKVHLMSKELESSQADVAALCKALLDTVPGSVQRVNAELDALAERVSAQTKAAVETHFKQLSEEAIRREQAAEARMKETITAAISGELAKVAEQRQSLLELQREILQSIALAREADRQGFIGRLFGSKA